LGVEVGAEDLLPNTTADDRLEPVGEVQIVTRPAVLSSGAETLVFGAVFD